MHTSRSIRFGAFVLDPARRVLERDGSPVPLSGRGFDLLCVLIDAADRVVGRPELLERVWPGVTVEEHNLSVQMSKLRQALGDAEGQLIVTVPGRGYQFVADRQLVEPLQPLEAPAAIPRRGVRVGSMVLAAVGTVLAAGLGVALWRPAEAPPLSIVVMPLRDLSADRSRHYLVDAVTDDLTTDLARLPGSMVIARETAESLADRNLSVATIGRSLSVRYLLEGSMSVEDSVVHINAQLIRTDDEVHLWAQRFDVPRDAMGSVRDLVVAQVAGALDRVLTRAEIARANHDRPDDPDALDLFFRARSLLDHDDSSAGFQTAQGWLERAAALRPDFADAQAELARMLLRKVRSTDDGAHALADRAEARHAIDRALAVHPDLPVALAARAQAEFIDHRVDQARYSAEQALAVDPSTIAAREVLSGCDAAQGRIDAAAAMLEAILQLDPEGVLKRQRALRLGYFDLLRGRPDAAEDWLRRAIAGDPEPAADAGNSPESWGRAEGARLLLIAALGMQGHLDAARSAYQAYDRLWPRRTVWRLAARTSPILSRLPGFERLTDAWHAAGMPRFAGEADWPAPETDGPLPDQEFVATPLHLAGATTLDTVSLQALLHRAGVARIVDLGSGAGVIAGAAWLDDDSIQTDNDFVRSVLAPLPGGGRDQAVVLMSDGVADAAGYNAARDLVSHGFRQVMWYRGGEEAWAAASLPAHDLRH